MHLSGQLWLILSAGRGLTVDGYVSLFQPLSTMAQTQLTKPAPEWSGTAVVNGEFKQIKLSDYKGKYVVFFFYPLDL